MGLEIPEIIPGDWNRVRIAFQKLKSLRLGQDSSPTYVGLTLTGLTASRLVATNASKALVSSDLASWVAGTANRVTVSDDGDGTVTFTGPQDYHTGASPTFANLTSPGTIQAGVIIVDTITLDGNSIKTSGDLYIGKTGVAAAFIISGAGDDAILSTDSGFDIRVVSGEDLLLRAAQTIQLAPNGASEHIRITFDSNDLILRSFDDGLIIKSDSGTISFDDDNLTTSGHIDLPDNSEIQFGAGGSHDADLGADAILKSDGTNLTLQLESDSSIADTHPRISFYTHKPNIFISYPVIGFPDTSGIGVFNRYLYVWDTTGTNDGFVYIPDKANIANFLSLTYDSTNNRGVIETFATGSNPDLYLNVDSVDIKGGLQVNLVTKTGAYTATASDYTIICNASGGSFTITLPAAASHTDRIYHIKKIDSSVNTVTIDGNASETIDGGTTAIITTQYESVTIQSDGSNWHIL